MAPSLFLNLTVSPVFAATGLGLYAWFPIDPTMATVTICAAGDVGAVGVLLEVPPPPAQLQSAIAQADAKAPP
jgi:hypothetical protein